MRLLPRYVLIEFLKVFTITVTALTTMMILVGVGKEALDAGLGPLQVASMVPYLLPNALVFALPGSSLFAASIVYGRMSGSNEVVALKSLGISPTAILWPVFGFVLFLSLISVWLNDVAVSWGFANVQRIVVEAIDDIAYRMLRSQKAYSTSRFSINVREVVGKRLIRTTLTFPAHREKQALTITADESELRTDRERGTLTFICRNASVDYGDGDFSGKVDVFEHEIMLLEAGHRNDATKVPAHLPLRVVPTEIRRQKGVIAATEEKLAARAAFALSTGDLGDLSASRWKDDQQLLAEQYSHLYRLRTEPPRRWANGFSCLCFVLVGAPMAIRLRNADFLTSFFICFLPILVVYYPLLIYGVDRAKGGALPPYGVWLGNVMLVAWGAWVLKRVIRF